MVLAEAFTRMKGFAPLPSPFLFISLEPPGNYFIPHSTRGYAYSPGEVKVTVPGLPSFKVTHASDGSRITHPLANGTPGNKKEIWIFGCSFTHGWGLNDEETYPWLLQRDLPEYEVVNFGVDGYSTVQSLLQLQETLASGRKPAIVVLSYAPFHDGRNALVRSWKKAVLMNSHLGPLNFPYATLGSDGRLALHNEPLQYAGLALLRHSALANYLDNRYNDATVASYDSHNVSIAVVNECWTLCKSNGIEFVLAGILPSFLTSNMLQLFDEKGLITVDIGVDLGLRENLNPDGHPSAIANKQFAQKLEAFLRAKLINKAGVPTTPATQIQRQPAHSALKPL